MLCCTVTLFKINCLFCFNNKFHSFILENIEFEEVCLNSTSSSLNQVPDSSSDSRSIQGTNSPVLTSTPQNSCAASITSEKPSTAKREGNCRIRDRKDAINYQSSRATSLLNIFISNSHGMFI